MLLPFSFSKVSNTASKFFTNLSSEKLLLPELSEPELVRHFTNLSSKNHHIDKGFYPLGSCTMKYNPKINDTTANLDLFRNLHPLQDSFFNLIHWFFNQQLSFQL